MAEGEDLVHIRVGTVASSWYTTACGKSDGTYRIVVYKSRHLSTCSECKDVFDKKDEK